MGIININNLDIINKSFREDVKKPKPKATVKAVAKAKPKTKVKAPTKTSTKVFKEEEHARDAKGEFAKKGTASATKAKPAVKKPVAIHPIDAIKELDKTEPHYENKRLAEYMTDGVSSSEAMDMRRKAREKHYTDYEAFSDKRSSLINSIVAKEVNGKKPFKTHKEAEAYFKSKGVKACSFRDTDVSALRSIKNAFDHTSKVYPELVGELTFFGDTSNYDDFLKTDLNVESIAKILHKQDVNKSLPYSVMLDRAKGIQAGELQQWDRDNQYSTFKDMPQAYAVADALGVKINPEHYFSYERSFRSILHSEVTGFSSKGDGTGSNILYHEFGHIIDSIINDKKQTDPKVLDASRKFWEASYTVGIKELESSVSGYSTTSLEELFAEIFVKHMSGTIGTSTIEKAFLKLIETAFGKRRV